MTQPETRRFAVHARHEDHKHGRVLTEPSFEAAAIAYVEHLPLGSDVDREVSVVVRDLETGHEHSFTVQVDTDERGPHGRTKPARGR